MGLLIIFLLVSILFSFLCSVLEAVLLSVTPSYVKKAVNEGGPTGKLLEAYKEDIDRPLSAILTLNTIAHTVGAIGVGAQAGAIYGSSYINLGPLELSYESIIATLMTLAILVLSEIIPKTIGANNWKALAPFTVRTLRVMLWILYPLVWLSQLITKSLKKEKERSVLSRADFAAMAQVGEESGTLGAHEYAVISNLLDFDDRTVRDIMTPKTVVFMGHEDTTLADLYADQQFMTFSRIPIYQNTRDHVTGMVLKDDILQNIINGKGEEPLKSLKRAVLFVSDDLPLPELFHIFSSQHKHMVLVNDNFGNVVGLATMEDLFETLLGFEIVDESDKVENMQSLAKRLWEQRKKSTD